MFDEFHESNGLEKNLRLKLIKIKSHLVGVLNRFATRGKYKCPELQLKEASIPTCVSINAVNVFAVIDVEDVEGFWFVSIVCTLYIILLVAIP